MVCGQNSWRTFVNSNEVLILCFKVLKLISKAVTQLERSVDSELLCKSFCLCSWGSLFENTFWCDVLTIKIFVSLSFSNLIGEYIIFKLARENLNSHWSICDKLLWNMEHYIYQTAFTANDHLNKNVNFSLSIAVALWHPFRFG